MVRLTAALVQSCPQVTNPLGERTLIIRGHNIQQLEAFAAASGATVGSSAALANDGDGDGGDGQQGLAASRDLLFDIACNFDALDLSENALTRLDGMHFPPRPTSLSEWSVVSRLSTLILHGNRVSRISASVLRSLAPTLHTFVAHNNNFCELRELDVFAQLPNLERLALLNNPVTLKPTYRVYVVGCCGTKFKLLDYNRVTDKERSEAAALRADLRAGNTTSGRDASAATAADSVAALFDGGATSAFAALDALMGDASDFAVDSAASRGGKRGRGDAVEPGNGAPRQPAAAGAAAATTGSEPVKLSEEERQRRLAEIEAKLETADASELAALEAEFDFLTSTA